MAATVVTANKAKNYPRCHQGTTWIRRKFEIPATSLDEDGDVVLLLDFTDVDHFWRIPVFEDSAFTVATDDLDSGANSDIDFGICDVDGVLDTTLISGGSIGQAAATHNLDASLADVDNAGYISVEGKYLAMRQTAATAGATAGTIAIALKLVAGVVTVTDDLT